MKRSYPGEAENRTDKKECGQTPQIILLLCTQTPRLLVNTVSVAAAPIQRTSFTHGFTSLPSPAPENNNVPLHRTVLRRGHDPLLSIEKCSSCCNMFHCDYCKMLHKHLHEAKNHVANHLRNAVQQEGFVIIKCGLGCRQAPHFHCCYCTSTLIRRDALIKHLTACRNTSYKQPPPIVPAAAPPPPSTAEVPPSQVPPSPAEEPLSPAQRPPSTAEGPPSSAEEPLSPAERPPHTADGPPSPAEEPLSPADGPPSPAEEPLSPADEPRSTAEEPLSPADGPRSTAEGPPSSAEEPLSPAQRPPHTADGPRSTAEGPPSSAEEPLSPAQRPPHTADGRPSSAEGPPSSAEEPLSPADGPPHTADGPPSTADGPPHTADGPPSTAEGPPSSAEEPLSPAERPPHTADGPPHTAEGPPSPAERPPHTADGPPSPAEEPLSPTERPPSKAAAPPTPAEGPPSAAASSSAVRLHVRQQVRVACPHCDIQINKRNLLVHINRRHRHNTLWKDLTSNNNKDEDVEAFFCYKIKKLHRTVLRRGHDPLLSIEKCSSCCNMFHCDYCKMLHNHLHQAQNHVANHLRNAVQQEGFVIIKCGLGCRQTPHFHCCYCKSTLIRKDALIKHITTCKNTSDRQSPPIVPAAPPPPPSTAEVPSSRVEGPPPEVPPSPPEVAPFPSQVPPSTAEVPPFPAASSSAVRLRVRQQVRVACPHCDIQINKKNLLVHINRKHSHTTVL